MNSKVIFIIVLLLIILALVYKMMQSMKLQSELTIGIAKKAGVPIPAQPKKLSFADLLKPRADSGCTDCEEETEDTEYEEQQEENQEEENGEEETLEQKVEREELERQEEQDEKESEESNDDEEKKSISTHLKVVKPKNEEKIAPKAKTKKSKLKGYEMIAELLSTPLNAGDLKDKYRAEFGAADDVKIIYNLNYALKLNIVKKQLIGKRYIYGTPAMFDGDVMKEEFMPKTENSENQNNA